MRLAAHAVEILAAHLQRVAQNGIVAEGVDMAAHRLGGDLGETDALDQRGVPVKYWLTKSERSPTASKICAPQ